MEREAHDELSREKRILFRKLKNTLLCLHRNRASHLVKALHELGASAICLGNPFSVAHEEGNGFTLNLWSYRKPMDAVGLKVQEYGMKAFEVVEQGTPKYCAHHGAELERYPRGVASCPPGRRLHSGLNGALSILEKATNSVVSTVKKPFSSLVDHNTVAPVKGV